MNEVSPTAASVRLRELTKLFGETRAVDRVSLTIEPGGMVALLGPSGCGKTTTLRMIAGLVEPNAGDIILDGKPITRVPVHRRNIGMLFQNYALFPHMDVGDNIAFPLQARKVPTGERTRLVADALRLVQLQGMERRSTGSLSGGQQQRVALARALVFGPSLLLLDEPLAALDKQLREAMQLELKRIQLETGTTTIAVTHDQVEALSMADLVAIMNRGRLVQVGTPEEVYRRPADLFVATFLGEANLLPVSEHRVLGFRHQAVPTLPTGTALVRPEDVVLLPDPHDDTVPGRVELTVFQGTRRRVSVRCAGLDSPLVVSVPPEEAAPEVGSEVHVALRGAHLHVVPETAAVSGASAPLEVPA
jgi:putative spermidine/putrescine transport system ATP-binding protein